MCLVNGEFDERLSMTHLPRNRGLDGSLVLPVEEASGIATVLQPEMHPGVGNEA